MRVGPVSNLRVCVEVSHPLDVHHHHLALQSGPSVGWLMGQLLGWLAGLLLGRLACQTQAAARQLVGQSVSQSVGRSVSLSGCLLGCEQAAGWRRTLCSIQHTPATHPSVLVSPVAEGIGRVARRLLTHVPAVAVGPIHSSRFDCR